MIHRLLGSGCVIAAVVGAMACSQNSGAPKSSLTAPTPESAADKGGNGAPSGEHYNLNLIGVPAGSKTGDYGSGQRIFINLEGKTTILLSPGPYDVIDGNGTDGEAHFQLPDPDPSPSTGNLAYSVWIRVVAGKGTIDFRSCFTDTLAATYCYAGALVQDLKKGKTFVDVSKDLLQVCSPTGGNHLIPLFDDSGVNFWWEAFNDGVKLVQMRFYPVSGGTIGGGCTPIPIV